MSAEVAAPPPATRRERHPVALGMLALTIAIGIAGWALLVPTLEVPVEAFGARGFQEPLGFACAILGWLVVTRANGNAIGWTLLVAGLLSCLQGFASSYVVYSVSEFDGRLPATDPAIWLCNWVWVPVIAPLATFLPILFPTGRIERRGERRVLIFASISVAAFAVAMAIAPGQASEVPIGVENPYASDPELADLVVSIAGPAFMLAVALSALLLVRRFRRATGEVRQQLKWLTFAASLVVLTATTVTPLFLFFEVPASSLLARIPSIAMMLSFIGIPVATGLAILRYGLYEIDVVISKTVTYGLLTVLITAVSIGIVVGIGAFVGSGADTTLTVVTTAIVALALQPLRARAQHLANRIVYGRRSSPYEALAAVSNRLAQEAGDPLPELARLMTEATAANRATVWLTVGDALRPVAAVPQDQTLEPVPADTSMPPGAHRAFPVRHEGELLGMLTVSLPANDTLTGTEERLLEDLASHAGLLLRNARLIEELRASRQRVVAAGDAERRKIERNIHDGAQQRLVALKVQLRLAQRVADDAQAIGPMLEQLGADVQDTIEELRALSHGIFPPTLVDRGLVAALDSAAARAALPVSVIGDGVGRYAADIEAAVYFCCLEALQNAGKYAGDGATVRVRLAELDRNLTFEVSDDGAGFDAATRGRGIGFENMHDRMGAIGGSLEITSAPGAGVTIRGRVPLPVS